MILNPYRYATGGGSDPHWANVVSSLPMTDDFTDIIGHEWSPQGGMTVSSGSALFDGTNDYLRGPFDAAFNLGTGDFTIEMDINPTTATGYMIDADPGNQTVLQFVGGRLAYYDPGVGVGGSLYNSGPTGSGYLGLWTHIAVSRNSGVVRAFLGGVKWGEQTASHNKTHTRFHIGNYAAGTSLFNGRMRHFRMTKGVGRYTTDFTPPVTPFPTS